MWAGWSHRALNNSDPWVEPEMLRFPAFFTKYLNLGYSLNYVEMLYNRAYLLIKLRSLVENYYYFL